MNEHPSFATGRRANYPGTDKGTLFLRRSIPSLIWMRGVIVVCALLFLPSLPAAAKEKHGHILDIQTLTTPGGIKVWLEEDHTLPIVALRFQFQESGTALESPDKQGLVRMLSNTMDEGAGDMDSKAFQKALADDSITLRFSAGRDGFGGQMETLSRNKDKAFELLALALIQPRFDEEAFNRMRDNNIARIRSSLSDPEWKAARLLNDRAFAGHPYAQNSGGTLSTLTALEPADLKKFHDLFLTRDHLIVSAAGDITAQELTQAVDQMFSALPKREQGRTVPDSSVQNGGETILYEMDVPQTFINIMLPAFGRDDPDYYALRMMNYIFGESGFGSRLMEEAREKRGLTYGIYSRVQNYRHLDGLTISTSTKNESAAEMLSIIREEMEKLRNVPVPEQELADAKSYLTGSLPLSLSSTDAIAGMMLSLQDEGLPADYLDVYADKINAVTSADIQRVARRILDPAAMTVVLVGKPKDFVPTQTVTELPNVE